MEVSKYEALGQFLRQQRTSEIPMTFAEIERVTETRLPPSARKHRPWWSNNPKNSVMTKVWLEAGFRTEQVDMERGRLVFRRTQDGGPAGTPPRAGGGSSGSKGGHHPMLGYLKGLVQIMPGTDLTQPADPAWGDVWDERKQ
jgi:hypothetical protein